MPRVGALGVGAAKRVYALTEVGVEELDHRATDLAEGERRIDAFLDRYLKARRLPRSSRRSRALVGRLAAHREASMRRGRPRSPGDLTAVSPARHG